MLVSCMILKCISVISLSITNECVRSLNISFVNIGIVRRRSNAFEFGLSS